MGITLLLHILKCVDYIAAITNKVYVHVDLHIACVSTMPTENNRHLFQTL